MRAAALASCEPLESRLLFDAGGGWIGTGSGPGGGIVGTYFPATVTTGTSSFARTDVRIDFTLPRGIVFGGGLANDPSFGTVPGSTRCPQQRICRRLVRPADAQVLRDLYI